MTDMDRNQKEGETLRAFSKRENCERTEAVWVIRTKTGYCEERVIISPFVVPPSILHAKL